MLCFNGSCKTVEARRTLSCTVSCAFRLLHHTDGLRLQCRRRRNLEGTGTNRCSVGLLEMITGALTLCTHNIAPSESGGDSMSVEELQVGVQAHHLAIALYRPPSPYSHELLTRMASLCIPALRGWRAQQSRLTP